MASSSPACRGSGAFLRPKHCTLLCRHRKAPVDQQYGTPLAHTEICWVDVFIRLPSTNIDVSQSTTKIGQHKRRSSKAVPPYAGQYSSHPLTSAHFLVRKTRSSWALSIRCIGSFPPAHSRRCFQASICSSGSYIGSSQLGWRVKTWDDHVTGCERGPGRHRGLCAVWASSIGPAEGAGCSGATPSRRHVPKVHRAQSLRVAASSNVSHFLSTHGLCHAEKPPIVSSDTVLCTVLMVCRLVHARPNLSFQKG